MKPFVLRALAIAAGLAACAACGAATEPTIALENESCRVEVAQGNGAIVRVRDKTRGLDLLQEPRLADNFRFTLPLPGKAAWQVTEANYVLGSQQRLATCQRRDGGLRLRWNGPLTSVRGSAHDVAAEMAIQLAGDEIRFTFHIENSTPLEIGEVFAPILGGCLGLGDTTDERRKTQLVVPAHGAVQSSPILQRFANMSWLRILGPEQSTRTRKRCRCRGLI